MRLFETITDLDARHDVVRARRYGVIDVRDDRFCSVRFRPFPKRASLLELWLVGRRQHRLRSGNRCRVYFNQPRRFPQFLSVVYAVSSRQTTLRTCRIALAVLDHVARLKNVDALLCHVASDRITDRLLLRCGWVPHSPALPGRHFIRRL